MDPRHLTWLGYSALLGLVTAVIATLLGHFEADAVLSPFGHTISDYAAADRAGAVETGIFLAGLAALPLLGVMKAVGAPISRTVTVLFGLWSGGLLVTAIVPTDPLDHLTVSTAGYVHRYASTLAFAALVAAGIALAAGLRRSAAWRDLSGVVAGLSAVAVLSAAAVTWATYFGDRMLIGLSERVMAAAMLGMLIILAVRAVHLQRLTVVSARALAA
ncbi:DUF998 domain-containing protein [Phytomonospora sp. NPDC050363]|uniref:DUF998 domain-containing protein n=1 Tax=Phytomonospora sp. NPDC050363 TaxID=3155642 RepID=UPI0033E42E24